MVTVQPGFADWRKGFHTRARLSKPLDNYLSDCLQEIILWCTCEDKRTSAAKAVVRRPFTARLNPCPSCRYAFPSACLALAPRTSPWCRMRRSKGSSQFSHPARIYLPRKNFGPKKPRGLSPDFCWAFYGTAKPVPFVQVCFSLGMFSPCAPDEYLVQNAP